MPLGAFKAALMGTAGASAGADVVLLATATADGDTSLAFTSGITSAYGEYIFRFYNINPAANAGSPFQWQVDANGGDNGYNDINSVSTAFRSYHYESGGHATMASLTYISGNDEANAANFTDLCQGIGTDADNSMAGELHLFNPSSTTYIKHWYSRTNSADSTFQHDSFMAGYWNTTSAINAVKFIHSGSGAFDGKIKLWGVK